MANRTDRIAALFRSYRPFDLQNLSIYFFEAALDLCVLSVGIGQPRKGLLRLRILEAVKNEAKLVIPRLGSSGGRHLLVPLRMGIAFLAHSRQPVLVPAPHATYRDRAVAFFLLLGVQLLP
jgi:hypothetical protein